VIILVPTAFVLSWWNGAIGNTDLFGRATYGIAGWGPGCVRALHLFLDVAPRCGDSTRGLDPCRLGRRVPRCRGDVSVGVRQHLVAPTVQWSQPSDKTQGNSLVYGETESPGFIPANAWVFFSAIAPRSTVGVRRTRKTEVVSSKVYACINTYPHKTQSDTNHATTKCYQKVRCENVVVYIPGGQFWTLQLREGLSIYRPTCPRRRRTRIGSKNRTVGLLVGIFEVSDALHRRCVFFPRRRGSGTS